MRSGKPEPARHGQREPQQGRKPDLKAGTAHGGILHGLAGCGHAAPPGRHAHITTSATGQKCVYFVGGGRLIDLAQESIDAIVAACK
jgi:hypothetical protein